MLKNLRLKIDTLNRLKRLINIYNKTNGTDQEIKDDIEQCIALYNKISPIKLQNFQYDVTNLNIDLIEDYEELQSYKEIYRLIMQSYKSFSISDIGELNYTKTKISETQLLKVCDKFFANLDDESYEAFKTIDRKNIYICNIPSFLMPLSSIDDYAVVIKNYPALQQFTVAIHELQHLIGYTINRNHLLNEDKKYYNETDAIFKELLAVDFISKVSQKDAFIRKYDIHRSITNHFTKLYYRAQACSIKRDYTSIEEFINNIFACFGSEEIFNLICSASIQGDMNHVFAYLLAIELYYLSKEDINKALEINNNFIKCDNNYLDYFKDNNIVPGKHLTEYSRSIQSEFKNIRSK